jgi:hypothetical protein
LPAIAQTDAEDVARIFEEAPAWDPDDAGPEPLPAFTAAGGFDAVPAEPIEASPPAEPLETFAPDDTFDTLPPPLEPIPEMPMPPPAAEPSRSGARPWLVIGSAVAIVSVGGYAWSLRSRDTSTQISAGAPLTPQPPQATAPAPDSAPPAEPPPAPPPSPYESELVTIRPAWVRIIADGERILERELAADTRIPFTARERIVIRVGDPAAVRLTIGGVDQGSLGPEGQPVTRTFEITR